MLNCEMVGMKAADALYESLVPRAATSARRQANLYADAFEESHRVFEVMKYCCAECGVTIQEPPWRAGGGSESIKQWCESLFDQMHGDKIGRITFDGNHATYNWYEVQKQSGILSHSLMRHKWTHTILEPKLRRLPVGFVVPAKAQRMLDRIESVEVLRKSCRVVQGMLVGEKQEVSDRWTERTAAGRALDITKAFAVQTAQMIGDGIVGMAPVAGSIAMTVGSVAMAVGKLPAEMVTTALSDPAIVCGDVVFFGWKD